MTIADAEAVARRKGLQAVVLIEVGRDGFVTAHTWGETNRKCGVIGKWATSFLEHGISVVPFRTVFGWGNGGMPQALTAAEREGLSPYQQKWADEVENAR